MVRIGVVEIERTLAPESAQAGVPPSGGPGFLAAAGVSGSDGSGEAFPRWIQAVLDWLNPSPPIAMGEPCLPPRPPGP